VGEENLQVLVLSVVEHDLLDRELLTISLTGVAVKHRVVIAVMFDTAD
jgi:hypothetical protein